MLKISITASCVMIFLVILPEGLLAQQPGDGKVVVSVAGKKDVEIVGYVMRFSEWERHKVWGYRFDVKVYGGEEGQSYAKMGEPYLDVIVAPSKAKNYGSDLVGTLANLRKVNFKMLTKSDRGAALVRFKGKSNIYSNTGDLYMMTESMEVIAYKD
jgi:hypothetical protein